MIFLQNTILTGNSTVPVLTLTRTFELIQGKCSQNGFKAESHWEMTLLKKWCRKSPSVDRTIPCFTLVRCGAWLRVLAAFDCHELSTTDGVTQDNFCSTYRGSRLYSLLEKSHKYFKELTRNGEMKKGSDLRPALKQMIILCLTLDTCCLVCR